MKIAVIGTGIAGMGAAWLLNKSHDVTIYEKNDRIGGHSNTVDIEYNGAPMAVDTGFIVYNHLNYPNLTGLFRELMVETQASTMSFSVSVDGGRLEWSSDSLSTIFAQRRNLARPSFLAMLRDVLRFNALAMRDLDAGLCSGLSLDAYLRQRGFGKAFRSHYLLPMGAAIWSSTPDDMGDFPAESLIRFFRNHRLLSYKRPEWRTVTGGSRQYVNRLTETFRDRIRLGCAATRVERTVAGAVVTDQTGAAETFDHVVLATHSDEALGLLADPSEHEQAILKPMRYAPNTVYLHRDESLMPKRRRVWAAWNALDSSTEGEARLSVTYWMNRLQTLDPDRPVFVSLNPDRAPDPALTFYSCAYDHPQFDGGALEAQRRLDGIQGMRQTWFCGAYCGYGFHEDGLAAGLKVAEAIGPAKRPWDLAAAQDSSAADAAA